MVSPPEAGGNFCLKALWCLVSGTASCDSRVEPGLHFAFEPSDRALAELDPLWKMPFGLQLINHRTKTFAPEDWGDHPRLTPGGGGPACCRAGCRKAVHPNQDPQPPRRARRR